MSSRLSVQKPFVVATLPNPIASSKNPYTAAEVYGAKPGEKKRKRSELAVGINGESVNLYDISSSKLITSYALAPNAILTCPPSSLRTRISKAKFERRTYVSTQDPQPQVTLFHEFVEGTSPANLQTTTRKIENSASPIIYIGSVAATVESIGSTNVSDLLVVHEDGEIRCYDGTELENRWISPAVALKRDVTSSFKSPRVEFAQLTTAFSASQGILKGRPDVFTIFPQEISEDGFNPEILMLITRSGQDANTRTLHMISLPRRSAAAASNIRSVESLLTVRIPSVASTRAGAKRVSFSIQASAGVLQQLDDETLTTFDFHDTLPKQQSSFRASGGQSFLRLTNTSIMVSSNQTVTVYNPKYRSVLTSVSLDKSSDPQGQKRKRGESALTNDTQVHVCNLITYFPKLGSAIAIDNNQLIGFQLDGQQDRQGKLRTAGLLIDSLGCSVKDQSRPCRITKKSKLTDSLTLGSLIPGSISRDSQFTKDISEIDSKFIENEMEPEMFDKIIGSCIGIEWEQSLHTPMVNGSMAKSGDAQKKKSSLRSTPSDIDRRWGVYALSKIFTWAEDDNGELRLAITFFPNHTFTWLIESGQMTVNNVESALRKYADLKSPLSAGQLVSALVEIDRDMDLLLGLVAKTHLDANELLHAIRKLMESLGLLGENPATKHKLLTNGEIEEATGVESEEDIERLEAEIEKDLELAEYQLGSGSGVRGEALSLALSKLYKSPNHIIVHALQETFSNQEVVCLIYLLRFEMAKGAWTTKYTDADEDDLLNEDGPDNAIVLLSSLLNNCIDAVGAGGWLTGEARLVDGDPFEAEELINSLKLEVSAALEGINEAVYLKGITAEMIQYGDAVNEALPKAKKRKDAPITLPSTDEDLITLPIGMKAEKQISLLKVGVGGAVNKRSMRDVGHQKSQKVGKYTRERISV